MREPEGSKSCASTGFLISSDHPPKRRRDIFLKYMSQTSFSITGIIHAIRPAQTRGSGFTTQNVVLEIPGYKDKKEYPAFEFFGKKCENLDQFRVGDSCEIKFELKGREHNGRDYSTLSAWQITHAGSNGTRESAPRRQEPRQERRQESRPAREHFGDRGGVADSSEIPF